MVPAIISGFDSDTPTVMDSVSGQWESVSTDMVVVLCIGLFEYIRIHPSQQTKFDLPHKEVYLLDLTGPLEPIKKKDLTPPRLIKLE